MKYSFASVVALTLTAQSVAAWSSVNVGRTAARSVVARPFSAAALFGYSTEQTGETGTAEFRLGFKGEVSLIQAKVSISFIAMFPFAFQHYV